MAKNKKKDFSGVVYSTDPDYDYISDESNEDDVDVPPSKQNLKVLLDKKQRGGKAVTLISGYIGSQEALSDLGKSLKQKCGVGGSVKDGDILIQGDFRSRVVELLAAEGYRVKQSGG